MQEKQKLRKQMRALLSQMSDPEISLASVKILDSLVAHPKWKDSPRVLAFVPLPTEPQILDELLTSEKSVAVPRIVGEELEFCEILGRSELHAKPLPGPVGRILWEPPAHCAPINPCPTDLILVPGLAFTGRGKRLGRGGGFYDRFLETFPGPKWGVCFPCQILDQIPIEEHDAMVDICFC